MTSSGRPNWAGRNTPKRLRSETPPRTLPSGAVLPLDFGEPLRLRSDSAVGSKRRKQLRQAQLEPDRISLRAALDVLLDFLQGHPPPTLDLDRIRIGVPLVAAYKDVIQLMFGQTGVEVRLVKEREERRKMPISSLSRLRAARPTSSAGLGWLQHVFVQSPPE